MILQRKVKGLSLIELLVAIGLLAMIIVMAGQVFRIAAQTTRLARANAEILQRLRLITQQLDADLRGLNKDGDVFMGYIAVADQNSPGGFRRLDRMMFYTTGPFRSTRPIKGAQPLYGQAARVGYLLSDRRSGPGVLIRFQHIVTADRSLPLPVDPNTSSPGPWKDWAISAQMQYDLLTIQQWAQMPFEAKRAALIGMMGVDIQDGDVVDDFGSTIDPEDPCSMHLVLADWVGQFKVQAWSDVLERWIPDEDPDGDGSLSDSDLLVNGNQIQQDKAAFVLYSTGPVSRLLFGPGVGTSGQGGGSEMFYRAFRFTITLYDSKGIIKGGRTFTYIVDLQG